MSASAAHTRLNTGVLATAEKRVLLALARALPHRIHSDHLSTFALVSMLGAAAGFAAMRVEPWTGALIVTVALVCNWFGDSLDGTVARVRGHERPRFGYYVDHVIDLSGTAALFIGLGVSGLMSPLLAAAVLAAYLLVAAEVYLATHAGGVFRMSWGGVGPTELRIVLVTGALYAAGHPTVTVPMLGHHPLFDVGGAASLVGLAAAFAVSATRQTRALFALEPRPASVVANTAIPQGPTVAESR
jgi:phosphatidylglycerophosphate synthase